jgi:hypothetical protein
MEILPWLTALLFQISTFSPQYIKQNSGMPVKISIEIK